MFTRLCWIAALAATVGCTKAPEPAPSAAPAPAATDPAAAAAAPAGEVGPDGPTTIAVPAKLDELVTAADAKKGEEVWNAKGCKACHNLTDVKLVGPGLAGVTKRRSLAWMGRMILKPEVMIKEDPVAKKLFAAHMTPMGNQNVDAATDLPNLLAFLKTK